MWNTEQFYPKQKKMVKIFITTKLAMFAYTFLRGFSSSTQKSLGRKFEN